MNLENTILTIREKISCGEIRDENDVTALIVNPLLERLGWPTANKNLVAHEYGIDGKRVDLALFRRKGKQEVFIEVKRIGAQSKAAAEDQLFGYLSRKGAPIAVLAYGYQWSFYHPYGPGEYKDRKILEIDLLRNSVQGCVRVLHRYLDRESVCSGTAADNVRADAENIFAHKEEKETFGEALNCLVEKRIPFSKIRLSQEFEDICGHLPASRDLDEFIKRGGLPPNCPITPLGTGSSSKEFYVMDARGEFCQIKSLKQYLISLYAPHIEQMMKDFPCETDAYQFEYAKKEAVKAIRNACWMRGEFDPNTVRGLGAWSGDNGELILHTGPKIMVFDRNTKTGDVFNRRKNFQPGRIGGYVYPNETGRMLKPAETYQVCAGEGGPGAEFLDVLKSLDWARPAVDPYIFMGLFGCAMIGGALPRRPVVWVTGHYGFGYVSDLTREIFNLGALWTSDVGTIDRFNNNVQDQPSLVFVDGLNLNTKRRREKAQLLRERVSTEKTSPVRGRRGAPTARSCFLFPLHEDSQPAPEDNVVILERSDSRHFINPSKELGARIFRRIIDGWPRWEETFAAFYDRLAEEGHNSSMAAQYAALLTAADLIMENHLPGLNKVCEMTRQITPKLPIDITVASSKKRPEFEHVLFRVLGVRSNGERMSAADLLHKRITEKSFSGEMEVKEKLGSCGMRVVTQNGEDYLAVANNHPVLKAQFADDTFWSKTHGKRAAWSIELGRIPGALKSGNAVRFDKGGGPSRAVLVPLAFLFEYIAACRL